jgi:hypothetical protein
MHRGGIEMHRGDFALCVLRLRRAAPPWRPLLLEPRHHAANVALTAHRGVDDRLARRLSGRTGKYGLALATQA